MNVICCFQITTLREALKFTKNENIRLQADQMKVIWLEKTFSNS